MTANEIIDYCLRKPGAYLDYPFGPDATIVKVKKRIFAQLFTLKGEPMATFNCDAMTGDFYRNMYPGIVTRGYHCPAMQQPYFSTIKLNGAVPDDVIKDMFDHSYNRVIQRLKKSDRKELQKSEYFTAGRHQP